MTRRLLTFSYAVLTAAALTVGCGGDDGPPAADAATAIDAIVATDAGPDATVTTVCETLCACSVANCTGFDMQSCVSDCAALPASVTSCRIEHCGYAKSNPTDHCPHVRGEAGSPGIPGACIDD